MLHHRTTDPVLRAWHVVEREEDEAFRRTGDFDTYCDLHAIEDSYSNCVREFVEAAEAKGEE